MDDDDIEIIDIDQAIALAGAESIFQEIDCERSPEVIEEREGDAGKTNIQLLEECLSLNQTQLNHLHDLELDIRQTLANIAQYRLNKEKSDKNSTAAQSFRPTPLSFISPYFKIPNGPSPYPNRDTLAKKANKFEFASEIPFKNPMNKEDQIKLEIAVSEEVSRTRRSKRPSFMIELKTEDSFISLDWKQITHMALNDAYSPQTCRLAWKNFLSPFVNRSNWSATEDNLIKELATKEFNWDEIAYAVENNRTPFLCFSRYARELSKSVFTTKWSSTEDALLMQVVDRCKINAHIPWSKVAYFIPSRTRVQCQQRYNHSLRRDIRRGHFTKEEDFIIIVGVKIFGKKWRKIIPFLSNRTNTQLNPRYNYFLSATFSPWTPEEDQKLISLVRINGAKNWVKVANSMQTSKNRKQCRIRYLAMCRQKEHFPGWTIADNIYEDYESRQFCKQQSIFTQLLQKLQEKFNIPSLEEDIGPLTIEKVHEILATYICDSDLLLFMRENYVSPSAINSKEDAKGGREDLLSQPESANARNIDPDNILPYNSRLLRLKPKAHKHPKPESYPDRRLRHVFMITYSSDILKARGESLIPQSKEEFKGFAKVLACYSSILNRESLNFWNSGLSVDMCCSLDEAFQASISEIKKSQPTITPTNVSAPSPRLVKTYVRKSRAHPNTKTPTPALAQHTDNLIRLLPPNLSSLVGMRCMLLDLHCLKVFEEFPSCDANIDNSVTERQSDLVEEDRPSSDQERQREIKQADEKLFNVFKTIFALPGIMTLHKPSSRSDLYVGSDLCAKNPLPMDGIIKHVSNTSSSLRRTYRRRSSRPESVSLSASEIETVSKRIKLETD